MARVLAVFALIAAAILVVATVMTSDGSDGDEDSQMRADKSGTTRAGERALNKGVWVVEDGDTLVSISEATGIELDDLVALNPDIDPQALIAGQRVSLRQSGTETGFSDDGDVGAGDPADEFGDGSVDGSSSP